MIRPGLRVIDRDHGWEGEVVKWVCDSIHGECPEGHDPDGIGECLLWVVDFQLGPRFGNSRATYRRWSHELIQADAISRLAALT